MPARGSATRPNHVEYGFDVEAELARIFGEDVRPLRFEEALFDAMLAGWARQQQSRILCAETIVNRGRLVCRLQRHSGAWPWEWRSEHLEEWIEDLALAPRRCHVSTLRNYQIAIRLFCDFVGDRRYPWIAICSERLGRCPQQIVDERNLIVHTNEFEADPSRRPLSRKELEAFFDHCDAQVAPAARCGARDRSRRSETRRSSRRSMPGGCAARRQLASTSSTSPATRTSPRSGRSGLSACATANRWRAGRRGGAMC